MSKHETKWDSEKIRALREKYLLKQEALHRIVGTSRQQTVSEWEVGKYLPSRLYQPMLDSAAMKLQTLWVVAKQDLNRFHQLVSKTYGFESEPVNIRKKREAK